MSELRHVCDLLVVGAGPAGLAAGYRAAQSGLRVTVVDDNPAGGGQIWRGEQNKPQAAEAKVWFERIRSVEIEFIYGARIFQQRSETALLAETPGGVVEIQFEKLVLATGARERFLPFPGWTLPNVMSAGGLQALVKTGLPIEGKRVVVAGSGPLLPAVAAYLRGQGAEVLLIAEQAGSIRLARFGLSLLFNRARVSQAYSLRKELSHRVAKSKRRVSYLRGCWVVEARGVGKVESVMLVRGRKCREVECDYLACGFHLVPNVDLAQLLGCEVEEGCVQVDQFQQTSLSGVYSAGESTGIGGLELSLVEGEIAGLSAAEKREAARALFPERARHLRFAELLNRTFALREELRSLAAAETVVCRCEDVTFERVRAHASWREAKLQTRCGMGPCQGRVCSGALEFLLGWRAESVRPPVVPVRVDSLAHE